MRTALPPSLGIHLGRTKTSGTDHDEIVYLTGRPVKALNRWLEAAKSTRAASFEKSIVGAMCPRERWNRAPSTESSSSARKWPALMPRNSQPTACAPAISRKRPIAAFRSPKPWNNRAIAPCSRHPTITTTPNGAADGRRVCFEACADHDRAKPRTSVISGLQIDSYQTRLA